MQTKELCDERSEHFKEQLALGKERMDKHSETLDRLDKLITEMATISKNHDETLRLHEKRLQGLEKRPGTLWDKVISGIISAAVAAFMALIVN